MKRFPILLTAAALGLLPCIAQTNGNVAKGEKIFQEQCAGCHGADGKATTEMAKKVHSADLTSESVRKNSDSHLAKSVANGKDKMPPFKNKLSDDDIRDVLAYVRSLPAAH